MTPDPSEALRQAARALADKNGGRLETEMASWVEKVAQALAAYHRVPRSEIWLKPRRDDAFRLLNWKVWCMRYHVPLDYELRTLLDHFSFIPTKQRPGKLTLGISIATLMGEKAQHALEEAVQREYPGGENKLVRCNEFQQRMIGPPPPVPDPLLDVRAYQRAIDQRRRARSDAKKKFSRRPWRGNPWR